MPRKKGHDDWADLQGKQIAFSWCDGWEDYYVEMTFSHTAPAGGGRYYITDDLDGGYSVWEDEVVEVTVLD